MMEAPLNPPEKYKRCKFRACSFKSSSVSYHPTLGLVRVNPNPIPIFFNAINDLGVAPQAAVPLKTTGGIFLKLNQDTKNIEFKGSIERWLL